MHRAHQALLHEELHGLTDRGAGHPELPDHLPPGKPGVNTASGGRARPLNVLPTQEELDAGVVTILWARTPQELSEALTRQARIRNSLAPLTP